MSATDAAEPLGLREAGRTYAPGVAALVVLGGAAHALGNVVPHVSPLIAAVAIGVVVSNTVRVPAVLGPGVRTHNLWLEAGIVLMGARVSLGTLFETGPRLAVLVLLTVVGTILLVELLSNVFFGIPRKLGSLLAAGASVCGVSAVVGVAGSIRADDDQITYAAGTILLFDAVTLFTFPILGGVLGLEDRVFGIWAGLTMFSTGPVTAAGFAVSDVAGQWATVTKLARNMLLAALVGVYSVRYADSTTQLSLRTCLSHVPTFVLGFFAVILLTSSSMIPPAGVAAMTDVYRGLFLLAFAGLGLSVDLAALRTTGVRPIGVVLTALVVASVLLLFLIRFLLG